PVKIELRGRLDAIERRSDVGTDLVLPQRNALRRECVGDDAPPLCVCRRIHELDHLHHSLARARSWTWRLEVAGIVPTGREATVSQHSLCFGVSGNDPELESRREIDGIALSEAFVHRVWVAELDRIAHELDDFIVEGTGWRQRHLILRLPREATP